MRDKRAQAETRQVQTGDKGKPFPPTETVQQQCRLPRSAVLSLVLEFFNTDCKKPWATLSDLTDSAFSSKSD